MSAHTICFYREMSTIYVFMSILWVLIRIASILMSTHNICFYGEIMKIIPKLSSNTLFICYTGT